MGNGHHCEKYIDDRNILMEYTTSQQKYGGQHLVSIEENRLCNISSSKSPRLCGIWEVINFVTGLSCYILESLIACCKIKKNNKSTVSFIMDNFIVIQYH